MNREEHEIRLNNLDRYFDFSNFTCFAVATAHYVLLVFIGQFHRHCCEPCDLPDFDVKPRLIQTLIDEAIVIIVLGLIVWSNFMADQFYGFEILLMRIQIISMRMKSEKLLIQLHILQNLK